MDTLRTYVGTGATPLEAVDDCYSKVPSLQEGIYVSDLSTALTFGPFPGSSDDPDVEYTGYSFALTIVTEDTDE
jgi:hypothetical protein